MKTNILGKAPGFLTDGCARGWGGVGWLGGMVGWERLGWDGMGWRGWVLGMQCVPCGLNKGRLLVICSDGKHAGRLGCHCLR